MSDKTGQEKQALKELVKKLRDEKSALIASIQRTREHLKAIRREEMSP